MPFDGHGVGYLVVRRTDRHVWYRERYSDGSFDEEVLDMTLDEWRKRWADTAAVRTLETVA